jgi:hypothetical protein
MKYSCTVDTNRVAIYHDSKVLKRRKAEVALLKPPYVWIAYLNLGFGTLDEVLSRPLFQS